jgi:hypothetical protein
MKVDENGNEIIEEVVDEKIGDKANERIRGLVKTNKQLQEKNQLLESELSKLGESIEEIKKSIPPKDLIDKIKNVEKKVDESEFQSFKRTILETQLLSEDALSELKSIKEIEVAVKIAKLLTDNFNTKVDEEANKRAKVILNQKKSEVDGERISSDKKHEEFKSKLLSSGLI